MSLIVSSKLAIDIVGEIKGKNDKFVFDLISDDIYRLRSKHWNDEKSNGLAAIVESITEATGGLLLTPPKRCWHSFVGDSVHHTRHAQSLQTIPQSSSARWSISNEQACVCAVPCGVHGQSRKST